MRCCTKCEQEKTDADFSRRGDGLAYWCKDCFSDYQTERRSDPEYVDQVRKKNRDSRRGKVHPGVRSNRQINRDYVWALLTSSACVDCGEGDPLCLDFDHKDPTDKAYRMSALYDKRHDLLKSEIAKCEIRCANCHRRKSSFQLGHWRSAYAVRDGLAEPYECDVISQKHVAAESWTVPDPLSILQES